MVFLKDQLIDGDKFVEISDIIYDSNINSKLKNYFNNNNDIPLIYCHTDQIFELFKNVDKKFNIILISHNSDKQVREKDVDKIPNNVKYWFANNLIAESDNVTHIPTGLERDRWYPKLMKKDTILKLRKTKKSVENLAYMAHNANRQWDLDRKILYKKFSNENWVSAHLGYNGMNFKLYSYNIYNHNFVFCPVGNQEGYDDGDNATGSHRFWEILYLNSIPIVLNRLGNKKYDKLPVCYVDEWDLITEDFLVKEYKRIITSNYNFNILDFNYWKEKIISKKNELI